MVSDDHNKQRRTTVEDSAMMKPSGIDIRSRILGIALIALTVLLSGLVGTGDARTDRTDRQSVMPYGQQQRQSDFKKVTGTVKRMKHVELRGQGRENLVVQLRTKNGERTLVDLGDAEELEDIDIQKGDRISAWGRSVNIGDKHVFMAHKLRANGESFDIERRPVFQQSGRQGLREPRQRRGEFSSGGSLY